MTTPNTRLYDLDVRHQVGVSRLCASMSEDLQDLVDVLQARVETIIRSSDLTGIRSISRTQKVVDLCETAAAKFGDDLADKILSETDKVVEYELEFQETAAKTVTKMSVAHPSVSKLLKSARNDHVQGRTVQEWSTDVAAATFRRVRDKVRIGAADEDNRDGLVNVVLGSSDLKYKDGALGRTRSDVSGLVRTVVTYTTVLSKTSLFELNRDVYDREQWCSLLDGSTSSPCRANDGKVFKVGEGPRPPAHWGCRSTILGLLKGQPAPARETYERWLKRQDADVQDEVLGATQARLWRDGGLKLDRFVDRTGQAYTLDELRSREARAFAKIAA